MVLKEVCSGNNDYMYLVKPLSQSNFGDLPLLCNANVAPLVQHADDSQFEMQTMQFRGYF